MWKVQKFGIISYKDAYEYQLELVKLKLTGLKDNFLLLLQHDHVFTMGKGADRKNILAPDIEVITINRGGDITYHGPGQLIGYVIMDYKGLNLDLHKYLRNLEKVIINTLEEINIHSCPKDGYTGVWVENRKIASIGVGVKQGITMHGFALNVNNDLSYFQKINPCGLDASIMTSVQTLTGVNYQISDIESILTDKFLSVFSMHQAF